MDDAAEVRADLRSYALRRCIRFYAAILVGCIVWSTSRLTTGAARGEIMLGGASVGRRRGVLPRGGRRPRPPRALTPAGEAS